MKNILIIIGSPRKKGNTYQLAQAFLKGAQEEGAQVRVVDLAETRIQGCLDCSGCEKTGRCVQKDGMEEVYEAIGDCDLLVLATPIFFFSLSAQLKAVLDRLHSYALSIHYQFPPKECVLLAVAGDKDPQYMQQVVTYYQTFTNRLGWVDRGIILAPGAKGRGAIQGHVALKQAQELGKALGKESAPSAPCGNKENA